MIFKAMKISIIYNATFYYLYFFFTNFSTMKILTKYQNLALISNLDGYMESN